MTTTTTTVECERCSAIYAATDDETIAHSIVGNWPLFKCRHCGGLALPPNHPTIQRKHDREANTTGNQ